MFIVGEASGDAHAARVVSALKAQDPTLSISGVGGEKLRQAGMTVDIDFSELAVMGLVEVLKQYRHLKGIYQRVVQLLHDKKPNLLCLVDYPGFNLKLAKDAKRLGIPIVYYISPKVWAWRPNRVKIIQRYVDKMLVLFPFEVPIYQQAAVPVSCVGHPLVDAVKRTQTLSQAKEQLGLNRHPVIGLFPGSRQHEIASLLPLFIDAAEKIALQRPDVQFVIPVAPGIKQQQIETILARTSLPIEVCHDQFYQVASACDAVVAASGTVTLELALLNVPHFICYRVSAITYYIMRVLIRIPYVGLCNIVTNDRLITEVLQTELTANRIEKELLNQIADPDSHKMAAIIGKKVRAALGQSGGACRAAEEIKALLHGE